MKRKVIKQGPATLMISLPSKWAKNIGLKQGDEVELIEKGNGLLISSGSVSEGKECLIELKNIKQPRQISRPIFIQFRKGYDIMKITFDDRSILDHIRRYLDVMMGFEITEQGNNYCIIKNVAKIDSSEFDNLFRRYFLVTLRMADESINFIEKKDFVSLKDTALLENTQNKLYATCSRMVNKSTLPRDRATAMFLLLQRMEDIGDDYKYMCQYLNQLKPKNVSKEIIKLYKDINVMLRNTYDFYYKKESIFANNIISDKKKLIVTALDLLEKVQKKELRLVHKLTELIVKIYECTEPNYGVIM